MTATATTAQARDAAALRLAVGRLSRRMRQESATGLSLTQLGILHTLDRVGPTTLGDLATSERVAPPTITKAVASLVEADLVEKVGCPEDRRVHRAQLTRAGRAAMKEVSERRDAWLATRLATLDPADRDRLLDVVPLLRALSEEPDPPGTIDAPGVGTGDPMATDEHGSADATGEHEARGPRSPDRRRSAGGPSVAPGVGDTRDRSRGAESGARP